MMGYEVIEKLWMLWPELVLMIGGVLCLVVGLAKAVEVRKTAARIAAASLVLAGMLVPATKGYTTVADYIEFTAFVKTSVLIIGFLLVLILAHVPHQLKQSAEVEKAKRFDPGDAIRGEFFAFILFSIVGVMLTAGSNDLVWLFLALEMTSLPIYVIVATSRDRIDAQEAAVKYFFLGAMSAAMFLFGFALIYGATGYTVFSIYENGELVGGIRHAIHTMVEADPHGQISPMMTIGVVMAVLGLCFKISAVPMHFYTADVYEGATGAVTAFLAFIPKLGGFVALFYILSLVGWQYGPDGNQLPPIILWMLWIIAVLTMTVGNVLGLVQRNVKRMLAYSSIAHSGYVMIGLIVGPIAANTMFGDSAIGNGLAAVLFYIVVYALATIAAFGVLATLSVRGEEAETFEDITGMAQRQPALAGIMLISMLSLVGLPPLAGFLGKVYLFGSAIDAGFTILVVIALINSAISAGYYLKVVSATFFGTASYEVKVLDAPGRKMGIAICAVGSIGIGIFGNHLIASADYATLDIEAKLVPDAHAIEPDNTSSSRDLLIHDDAESDA